MLRQEIMLITLSIPHGEYCISESPIFIKKLSCTGVIINDFHDNDNEDDNNSDDDDNDDEV